MEEVRQKSHRDFASMILQTVQPELPTSVSESGMKIVSQAMVGAINEVIMQNFFENEDEGVTFDEISRILNRVVIGAFVTLGMQE
ncbi:hypothetical protein [Ferdinandcohnia sp. Marseille-Q9671]